MAMSGSMFVLIILVWMYIPNFTEGTDILVVTNVRDIRLMYATNSNANDTTVLLQDLPYAGHLDLLFSENRMIMIWGDILDKNLTATSVKGTRTTTLWTIPQELVSGVSVDWIAENVYWSNPKDNSIKVANINGQYERTLFRGNMDVPRDVAVDPYQKYMFWADRDIAKIERAELSGEKSSRQFIIEENLQQPVALTLDYSESRIYFSDTGLETIESADYDGANRRLIRQQPEVYSLVVYGFSLYGSTYTIATNNETGRLYYARKSIFKCGKRTGSNYSIIMEDLKNPFEVRIMDPTIRGSESPCRTNNGGCSDLCLPARASPHYTCACPTGVKFIDSSNRTCATGIENMLLLSRKYQYSTISLDTTEYLREDVRVFRWYKGLTIDYDPVEGQIYWLEHPGYHYIKRVHLNQFDEDAEQVYKKLHINGFVLDTVARKIYFTNGRRKRVKVMDMNGQSITNVISNGLSEPFAIDLDTDNGYLYWTDVGYPRKIERSRTDGSLRMTLVDTDLRRPDAICVDRADNKLYWADSQLDKIEISNLDGSERRVLVRESLIFSQQITVFGNDLFFLTYHRELAKVNKRTGEDRTIILGPDSDLRGLKAVKTTA